METFTANDSFLGKRTVKNERPC